jgi:hypothetical protein
LTEDAALRHQLVANLKRQLQKFLLRAEIEKLMRAFEKCSEGEFWPGGLQKLSRSLAILFLDLLYGASAFYLCIFRRK